MLQEILLYLFEEQEYFCQAFTVEINFMYLSYLNYRIWSTNEHTFNNVFILARKKQVCKLRGSLPNYKKVNICYIFFKDT